MTVAGELQKLRANERDGLGVVELESARATLLGKIARHVEHQFLLVFFVESHDAVPFLSGSGVAEVTRDLTGVDDWLHLQPQQRAQVGVGQARRQRAHGDIDEARGDGHGCDVGHGAVDVFGKPAGDQLGDGCAQDAAEHAGDKGNRDIGA